MRLILRLLKYAVIAVVLLAVGLFFYLRPPSSPEARLALVEKLATQGAERGYWPGIMWAAVSAGEVGATGAAGFADVASGRVMQTSTTMPIGSVSKVLVGLAAAQAVEDGLLDLDRPLVEFVTVPLDFPDGATRTFEHLATHTAGILDTDAGYEEVGYFFGSAAHPVSLRDFLSRYLGRGGDLYDGDANFGAWLPGTRYDYSNVAAGLAGQAVADAANEDFATYSDRIITDPLGLTGFWGHTRDVPAEAATLYELTDEEVFEPLPPYALATWPDGQYNASVEDLAKLLATILGDGAYGDEQIFSPEVIELLTTPRATGLEGMGAPEDKVGLFWSEETLTLGPISMTFRGHNGGDPGVLTFMYHDLDQENAFVLMMNGEPKGTMGLVQLVRIIHLLHNLKG